MRIAVCVRSSEESGMLLKWIGQYCSLYGKEYTISTFSDPTLFLDHVKSAPVQLSVVGIGGPEGFQLTRQLREMNRTSSIIVIDDTAEYAVKCVRIHVSDYIVRPVDFKKLARAMKLALMGERR